MIWHKKIGSSLNTHTIKHQYKNVNKVHTHTTHAHVHLNAATHRSFVQQVTLTLRIALWMQTPRERNCFLKCHDLGPCIFLSGVFVRFAKRPNFVRCAINQIDIAVLNKLRESGIFQLGSVQIDYAVTYNITSITKGQKLLDIFPLIPLNLSTI